MPALDEAGNIDRLIRAILEHGRSASLDLEVIVVDDGSTDGTRERVRAWEHDHPVRLLPRDKEKGLASAVLAGAALATGDVVVVMDADLSHPPEKIADLARPVLEGTSDLVIGSRYVPGGRTPGWPIARRIVSRAAAALSCVLADVQDPLSGFFALRRERLEATERVHGFKIGLEVLLRGGEGLRVREVPIVFRDRECGRSKLGPAVMGAYLRQLAVLAGGTIFGGSPARLALVGLAGMAADFLFFHVLFLAGAGLGPSHLGSFFAAAVLGHILITRWALAKRLPGPAPLSWRGYLSLAAVAFLAAFLRGGVLGVFAKEWGWPPTAAVIPAILAAALVSWVGTAFYVFSASPALQDPARRWRLAALGILGYAFLLRVVYIGQVNLMPQETYYWNYSQHSDLSYLDHPPMVAWLIGLGTRILGQTEFAVRIGGVACGLITVVFTYLLARNLLGKSVAFRAILLLGGLPYFFGIGFLVTPDTPLVACWAGALFFLERALLGERRLAWLGAGLFLGLGLLSKYSIALLGPAALAFLLLDGRSRRWLLRPEPYGSLVLAALLFAPVILWNMKNDWASFVFQGPERWGEAARFDLPVLLGSVLLLITPLGLLGFILGSSGRTGACAGEGPLPLQDLAGRRRLFVLVFTLVPLAVFVLSSLRSETKLNWTGPVWLAALPAMALTMLGHRTLIGRWLERSWKPVLVTLLIGYGALLHFPVLGFSGLSLPQGYYTMNWRDLGRQVEEIELEVIAKTGEEPLVLGLDKYHLSSELAFYDPNQDGAYETAGSHLLGKASLMYEYWFPPKLQEGKTLVLVSDDRNALNSKRIPRRVERLEPIRELLVHRDGSQVARYYARVGYSYRSSPPPDARRRKGDGK